MAFGMVVFAPVTSRRQTKPDMVWSDATELGSKFCDQMPKFKGPSWITVHKHDWFAFALVDKVHPMP
jgi:hypothetical protein